MQLYAVYENLDLEIEAYDAGYRAHVIASPVGQVGWTPFSLPFSLQQLQQVRGCFGSVRQWRPTTDGAPLDPKAFGTQLYASVFGGEIGHCLSRSLEKIGDQCGLRLRLRLNHAPDLADLPWEYLYGPPPFAFFALSTRTPIVRYLATPSAEAVPTVNLPLWVLVVIANPPLPGCPSLDVETEWNKLDAALRGLYQRGQIRLERIEAPTQVALRQRLRWDEPLHLLHFIGHGEMGALIFEDEHGQPDRVTAEVLGGLLRDHPTLRLAFLNACDSGRSNGHDLFTGIAPELVHRGLPAVIAMQYAISDRGAVNLAAEFYQAAAGGYPIDAALAEARKAVYVSQQSVEWGTPVLFTRSANNQLWAMLNNQTKTATPGAMPPSIDTGGGSLTQGDINTGGGDFVGRDQIINQGFSAEDVAKIVESAKREPIQSPSPLKTGKFTRKPFEPETILIASGSFVMGSNTDADNEKPQHTLQLPDYRIGKYPVTNAQYTEFLKRNPKQGEPQGAQWFLRQPPKGQAQHPVVSVSWHDALAYCQWLSQETGRPYRLPSEAEWEKAARGPDGHCYPWGDTWTEECCNIASTGTTPVDQFPAGASVDGCLDLLGNVEEWTNTLWGDNLNQSEYPYPYQSDDGREERRPPAVRTYRIHRGGSFRKAASEVRCSARGASSADSTLLWRGFRIVLAIGV